MTSIAIVICVVETDSTRGVVVRCPFCRKTHQHGWPYGTDEIGDRVSHCLTGRGGNYHVASPGAVVVSQ